MFGRKRTTDRHYGDGTVVTTTTTGYGSRTSPRTSGFMARLRPRRNQAPAYATAPAASTTHHTATRSSHKSHSRFGRRKHVQHSEPRHHHGTTTTTGPYVTPRKTSLGDKVSGAMMRLKGEVTGRPGVKGAGTRRMHGTDGRGPRRYY